MDLPEPRAMARSHILVQGLDSLCSGHLAVLLVHVVGARARVIPYPDAKILDLLRALLVDLFPGSA